LPHFLELVSQNLWELFPSVFLSLIVSVPFFTFRFENFCIASFCCRQRTLQVKPKEVFCRGKRGISLKSCSISKHQQSRT
jgi:hypothetical protein